MHECLQTVFNIIKWQISELLWKITQNLQLEICWESITEIVAHTCIIEMYTSKDIISTAVQLYVGMIDKTILLHFIWNPFTL